MTALVNVSIVRAAPLRETLVTYGSVVPAPGSVHVFMAPFDAIVVRLHIRRGQRVTAGQRLVQVAPSPEAKLLIESARTAVEAARSRTSDVQQRLQLGLTTRDQLSLQQQALSDAEARWATYSRWVDGLRVGAPGAGVVDRLPVAEGQRVPAGDLLASMVSDGRFEVELGVEPEDASLVKVGQPVLLERLAGAAAAPAMPGHVRSVSLTVDSATRLTTVLVAPAAGTRVQLLLGEFIRASITVRSATGLIVPRSALLPQETGMALFVVRGGRAFRRLVTVGVETDSLVQVTSGGLQAGDTVVVTGNYELADSMRVRLPHNTTEHTVSPPAKTRR
ncbi:MAG: efflux RND transporter periplasmic adaptor subunit [Gemmatimonadaceae bacterium]